VTNLINPPPIFTLPFAKGDDLYFGFIYKPLVVDTNGLPILDSGGKKQYAVTDYPAGATVSLVIETTPVITVDGDITGPLAIFWEDFLIADTVGMGKLWRVVITFANGRDKVMCNGTTIRSDGRAAG